MKKQILWKRIDVIGQLLMLVLPQCFPYHSYDGEEHILLGLFIALFTVGGWQIISALMHRIAFSRQYWRGGRKGYNITLVCVIAIAILLTALSSIGKSLVLLGLMALLLIGPLMAFWYFGACITELKYLVQLKRQMESGALTDFPTLQ